MNNQMTQMLNLHGVTGTGEVQFIVFLRDSSKLEFKSAMYRDSVSGRRFVVFIDKKFSKKDTNRYKKIFPSQTARLIRNQNLFGDYSHNPIYLGMPNDTCWMFKVINGPITAYSYLSQDDFGGAPDPSELTGMQLNNGAITKFSNEGLRQMIASDSTAMVYFEKKKYIKAIKKFNQNAEKISN